MQPAHDRPGATTAPAPQATWRPTIFHHQVRVRLAGDRLVREQGAAREEFPLADATALAVWRTDAPALFDLIPGARLQAAIVVGSRRIRVSGERLERPRARFNDDPELAALMVALASRRAAIGPGCRYLSGDEGDARSARAIAIVTLALLVLALVGFAWRSLSYHEFDWRGMVSVLLGFFPLLVAWRHFARRRALPIEAEA